MTGETKKIRLQFSGSDEIFTAPTGYDLESALAWIGRLHHPSIHRTRRLGHASYALDNGRRGANRRACVVVVVDYHLGAQKRLTP